jgi:hypothetical protein
MPPSVQTQARSVADLPLPPEHVGIGQTGLVRERQYLARVTHPERRAEGIADGRAEQAIQHRRQRGVARRVLDGVADRDGEPPAGPQHAQHLAQGLVP